MANKNAKGEWLDYKGQPIDPKFVKPKVRRRDRDVEAIFKIFAKLEEKMKKDKERIVNKIDKYIAYLEKTHNVERNAKGNLVLTNFSRDKQIELKVNSLQVFDENLQFAKSMIDNCLRRWSENGNDNLKVIVNEYFAVDQQGNVRKDLIWKLTTYNIKDTEWNCAMELIKESVDVVGTKEYLTAKIRSQKGKWQTLNLNFSSI